MATDRICSIEGCGNGGRIIGQHCFMHYQRIRKTGSPDLQPRVKPEKPFVKCAVDDCDRAQSAKGLCKLHYKRMNRRGSVEDLQAKFGAGLAFLHDHVSWKGGCLLWPFPPNNYGYGQVKFYDQPMHAHHAMCILAHGPKPSPEHEAAHNCGVRLCVAPDCLRWATPIENAADKEVHGTVIRGEDMWCAKLTDEIVQSIRRDGRSCHELGKLYGVSAVAINNARRGKTWKHVA